MVKKALIVLMGGFLITAGPVWAGDAAAGKAISDGCAGCHGDDGKGDPPIAGMAEADFIKAMKDYQSGAKENKKMAKATKDLSDDDIANLAAYFATLK
ncbi:MAG: c-type cytochrome [Thiobacillaceae bacterium]|jgi:cytochrome c553